MYCNGADSFKSPDLMVVISLFERSKYVRRLNLLSAAVLVMLCCWRMIGDFVVAFRFGFFVFVEVKDFVVPIGILVNKLLSKSIVSTGSESGI